MGELLARYLPALRAHLLHRKRLTPEQVDDLLQSFIAEKVLERNLIGRAQRGRGKFRTFLCTALDNYVLNKLRDQSARKRQPASLLSLAEQDDHDMRRASSDEVDVFDIAWARELLRESLRRFREECASSGRLDICAIFDGRIVRPLLDGAEPTSYEQLQREYALASPLQAANLLATGKRSFVRIMRQTIAEYAGEQAVDEEIDELVRILSSSGA